MNVYLFGGGITTSNGNKIDPIADLLRVEMTLPAPQSSCVIWAIIIEEIDNSD